MGRHYKEHYRSSPLLLKWGLVRLRNGVKDPITKIICTPLFYYNDIYNVHHMWGGHYQRLWILVSHIIVRVIVYHTCKETLQKIIASTLFYYNGRYSVSHMLRGHYNKSYMPPTPLSYYNKDFSAPQMLWVTITKIIITSFSYYNESYTVWHMWWDIIKKIIGLLLSYYNEVITYPTCVKDTIRKIICPTPLQL